MADILVGTCGYSYYDPGEDWKDEYESKLQAFSATFDLLECNRTFYELPQVSTAERWREEVTEGFTFAVKAWQAMIHPWSSPTWNGHRDGVPEEWTEDVGYLQPTEAVRAAWRETRERALALDASVVVVQTPPSFGPTDEHEADMRQLLGEIDRQGLTMAWEPRGDWLDSPEEVARLCDDLDLLHVVDRFRDEPTSDGPVYTRLHGRNDDRFDYDYDYSDGELETLATWLREYADDGRACYCLFNNYEMFDNAQTLAREL